MANIFKNPVYKSGIGYNGFEMSNLLKFSSTVGELLPIYYDILQPGDKVRCSTELRTRTLPLASSAMCHLTEHIEWFFVPMRQMYSNFEAWYYGINDYKSSALDHVLNSLPYLTTANLEAFVIGQNSYSGATDNSDKYFSQLHGTSLRLAEMLNLPVAYLSTYAGTPASGQEHVVGPSIHPFFALAYQKIYHDFYRLSDFEDQLPITYNLDLSVQASTTDVSFTPSQILSHEFFTLRYRPWKKDFFQNTFPSPLMGQNSVGSNGHSLVQSFHQWLQSGIDFTTRNQSGSYDVSNPTWIRPQNTSSSAYAGSLDVVSPTAIRTSFAVQKLLEVTRRAAKTYDAQQLAHFGVKLPRSIEDSVYYLGSSKGDINIGDVIATSTGSNAQGASSVLGQIAGKGYGYNKGNAITFDAPCHGILMAIYSCEPDVDYSSEVYDRQQTNISRADWYTPEFDNLGMQPLFEYQTNPTSNYSSIVAWQYRYSELKCKYNRVMGSLRSSLYYWSTARPYVTNTLASRYINPSFLDNIMLVKYNPIARVSQATSHDGLLHMMLWDTDPLIHECYFHVKKSSKMSTFGLESL